jgi:RNA polymerase sigma-70 factor, ECF subfamily
MIGSDRLADSELHIRLVRRETKALGIFIRLNSSSVYALVQRILIGLGNNQDVEECCSDVFHTAWEQINEFDPTRATLRTWLLMLTRYKALDYRKKLARTMEQSQDPVILHALPDPSPETPETKLLQQEEQKRILNALEALQPLDKELVYRRYFLFEPVQTIAPELGLTRQAADNRLYRARKTLRSLLEENVGEEAAIHEGK